MPEICNDARGWWLYVLLCEGDKLYVGIARDPDARLAVHCSGRGAFYTRLNRPVRAFALIWAFTVQPLRAIPTNINAPSACVWSRIPFIHGFQRAFMLAPSFIAESFVQNPLRSFCWHRPARLVRFSREGTQVQSES